MRRLFAPLAVAAAIAFFAAPASAQDDDPFKRLVDKLSQQVEQLEKKFGDLGKKLEETMKGGNLMEKFNDLWNDLELDKMFGDFKMPDLNDLMEQLRERFGDQFGDGFDLEDLMEQFKDSFGGVDLQQMMEQMRKLFEQPQGDEDEPDRLMPLPACAF